MRTTRSLFLILFALSTSFNSFAVEDSTSNKITKLAPGVYAKPISTSSQNNLASTSTDRMYRIIVKHRIENASSQVQGRSIHNRVRLTSLKNSARISAQQKFSKKIQKLKAKKLRHFDHLPFSAMEISEAGLRSLESDPDVVSIYKDRLSKPLLAGSTNIIGAQTAAAAGFSGQGQSIAIVDTGVDKSHSFLAGKVVHEACFSTTLSAQGATSVCPNGTSRQVGPGAGIPCSSNVIGCNHGTHVAGIAAGKGSSFSGVARNANIVAVQVFSRFSASVCGLSDDCVMSYDSDQIRALEHIYTQRNAFNIASVNMSLGGGRFSNSCDDDPLKDAIDLLRSANIATVIASGNEGYTNALSSPACISSAISVGSTTKADQVSNFSNSASFLDLLAPGEGIPNQTNNSGINSSVPGNTFSQFSGTSMAAPHVAGAIAVLKAIRPSATVDEIESALKSSGTTITDSRNSIQTPRINVNDARAFIAPSPFPTLYFSPDETINIVTSVGSAPNSTALNFVLRNITSGSANMRVSAVSNVGWLQPALHPNWMNNQQIPANGSLNTTVSLNSGLISSFGAGVYQGQITFRNSTNTRGTDTVNIQLVVNDNNDFFASADTLGINGETSDTINTSNNDATSNESGEPDHAKVIGGASLWWKWTAPSDGTMAMETCNSAIDTTMAVYVGTDLGLLTEVTSNDDACSFQSRVNWQARSGITYYIAVDGFGGEKGNIRLNWSFSGAGSTIDPITVLPATGISFSGASTGPFTPSSESYTVTNVSGTTQQINLEIPEWLSATPQSFTLLAGASRTVLFQVNSNAANFPRGNFSGVIDFGQTARTATLDNLSGSLSNDNFTDALKLTDGNQAITWNSDQASLEFGEPSIYEQSQGPGSSKTGGKSVWWKWTPSDTASVTINTEGSAFDTLLAVYTGSQLNSLTQIAGNDDSGSGLLSSIKAKLNAGTTYHIKVDGFQGASGQLQLNILYNSAIESNDFSGDNVTDIFWRNNANGANWMWIMDENNVSQSLSVRYIHPDWQAVAQGDFNADGISDVMWRDPASGTNWMWLMNRNEVETSVSVRTISPSWQRVAPGDFNGDGKTDVLWRNPITGQNWMWLMDANNVSLSQSVNGIHPDWEIGTQGDFNGDGVTDILWRNSADGRNVIWIMQGHTVVRSVQTRTISSEWQLATQGDFNADGISDLFWRNTRNGINWLWFMNERNVTRSVQTRRLADLNWKVAAQGDFNGDGFTDLFWRHSFSGKNWLWLMNNDTVIRSLPVRTLSDRNWNPADTQK